MAVEMSALWKSGVFAVLVFVGQFVYRWYNVRSQVDRLRKMGLAMPPWNWLTGHIPFIRTYLSRYPSNILMSYAIKDMYREHFSSPEMFYLDLWPLVRPTLVICNAAASYEVNRKLNAKPGAYITMFDPQSGGPSLLSTNGAEWKEWRGFLNPGFAPGYLMSRIAEVVDGVERFCAVLEEEAKKGEMFNLEDKTMRLTLETIMRISLNDDLNYQRKDHPVPQAVQKIIPLTSFGDLGLDQFNPIRYMKIKLCDRIIDRHFTEELNKRYEEYIADPSKKTQSIISLAIASYVSAKYPNTPPPKTIDPIFLKQAIPQIRMLLIAGHDTTTSILVYCYHMLSSHPTAQQKLHDEHTEIFGPDPATASASLRSPNASKLLNSLPYTVAVIKETLRLFPPGGAIRTGSPAVQLLDREGTAYPTEGCLVSIAHHAIHYNPHLYPDPEVFDPDRWIGGRERRSTEMGAFRPFEHGPRNCVGQDVAFLLVKVALVMTVRRFAVRPTYEESKEQQAGKNGNEKVDEVLNVGGEKANQTENGGTHPALAYPCRVDMVHGK